METKTNLEPATISKVQDLIRINIDSEDGFLAASKQIDNENLSALFMELSTQRAQNATELQDYVVWNGEKPRDDGSYAAAFHRTWMDLRAKLSGGDSRVVLSEAERGEDSIKHAYEDALKATVGSALNDVLTRQYANVKAGHDRIHALRDELARA